MNGRRRNQDRGNSGAVIVWVGLAVSHWLAVLLGSLL